MDFDEREDQEEDEGIPAGPAYDSIGSSTPQKIAYTTGGEGASTTAPNSREPAGTPSIRYKECLKNHAVSIGGHAVDGCGEFIAAGEEGTLDALKCAACNCHRNFHRKETTDGGPGGEGIYQYHQHHHQFSPYYHAPRPPTGCLNLNPFPQHRPLALPAASGEGYVGGSGYSREEDVSNPSSSGGGGGGDGRASGRSKKRHRTKFTQEQKEKMLSFAERLGWRIQKHDEAAVEQFCTENGVKQQGLKVWMHNNKHTVGKKP